jgi:hypothetical protein
MRFAGPSHRFKSQDVCASTVGAPLGWATAWTAHLGRWRTSAHARLHRKRLALDYEDDENEPACTRTDQGGLSAIVYVSTAARPLSHDELKHLQIRAQQRNLQESVTGVLLYSGGTFMQYLEGPPTGLARVYDIIKTDPTHYGVIDLVREPIAQRGFPEWSMAFRVIGPTGRASDTPQAEVLTHRLGSPEGPLSAGRKQLLKFWSRGRSSVASTLYDFASERAQRVTQARAGWRL